MNYAGKSQDKSHDAAYQEEVYKHWQQPDTYRKYPHYPEVVLWIPSIYPM
jgi:hypothetical protein